MEPPRLSLCDQENPSVLSLAQQEHTCNRATSHQVPCHHLCPGCLHPTPGSCHSLLTGFVFPASPSLAQYTPSTEAEAKILPKPHSSHFQAEDNPLRELHRLASSPHCPTPGCSNPQALSAPSLAGQACSTSGTYRGPCLVVCSLTSNATSRRHSMTSLLKPATSSKAPHSPSLTYIFSIAFMTFKLLCNQFPNLSTVQIWCWTSVQGAVPCTIGCSAASLASTH